MPSPYKRRRSTSLIRNLWVYRRLVLAAVVLGVLLWFVAINNTPVTIYFPFRLGSIASTSGLIILLGAFVGSFATVLIVTLVWTVRRYRKGEAGPDDGGAELPDERPPTDYASKTTEGFPDAPWSAR